MITRRSLFGLVLLLAALAALQMLYWSRHPPMPQGDFTFFDVDGPTPPSILTIDGIRQEVPSK